MLDVVANYSIFALQDNFSNETSVVTFDSVGTVVLCLLLIQATGAHPWLLLPNLLVHVAMHSETFKIQWANLHHELGHCLFLVCTCGFLPCILYWINGFFMLLLEVKWPNKELQAHIDTFKRRYKVQSSSLLDVIVDGPDHKPGQLRVLHVVKNLLIGQVCVLIPLSLIMGIASQEYDVGLRYVETLEMPSTWEMVIDIFCAIIVDEILFYYGHRLFHESTYLYKNIHKIHHEFQFPCALVAAYSHPIEMLVSNVLPLGMGLIIFRANPFTTMVWSCAAVCGTQTHHSGYRWPYTMSFDEQPNYHDYHHKEFTTNYGLLGWLDKLHGTDSKYMAFLKKQKKQA